MKGRKKTGICLPLSVHSSLCGKAEEIFFFLEKKVLREERRIFVKVRHHSPLTSTLLSLEKKILTLCHHPPPFFPNAKKEENLSKIFSPFPPFPLLSTNREEGKRQGRKEGRKGSEFWSEICIFSHFFFREVIASRSEKENPLAPFERKSYMPLFSDKN